MKTILIILLFVSSCYGQSYNCNIEIMQEKKSPIEKIIYTEIAVIGYGVADYFLYNSWGKYNVENYRFIQGVLVAGINYILAKYVSISSAVGFSIQCIGAVPDMTYYGLDKTFGHKGGFSEGNEFAINKDYKHLNFVPLAWGTEKAHGLDVVYSSILTTALSVIIQF